MKTVIKRFRKEAKRDLGFNVADTYLMGLFVYKFVCNILPPSVQNYLIKRVDVHQHFIRASGGLSVQYPRTNYRRFAVSCRDPIIWNGIPKEISALPSLYQFKRAWKIFIIYGNTNSNTQSLSYIPHYIRTLKV